MEIRKITLADGLFGKCRIGVAYGYFSCREIRG